MFWIWPACPVSWLSGPQILVRLNLIASSWRRTGHLLATSCSLQSRSACRICIFGRELLQKQLASCGSHSESKRFKQIGVTAATFAESWPQSSRLMLFFDVFCFRPPRVWIFGLRSDQTWEQTAKQMRKRAPLLFPTSLLGCFTRICTCLDCAERQRCAVHCVTFGGLWQFGFPRFHHATCARTSCVSFVSAASFGCYGLTQPYSVLRHRQPLQLLTAITYLFFWFFCFTLFFFILFLPRLLFGSRWPPTLGQRHCPWHRPCQDTMRAHGHAGKCTINMVAWCRLPGGTMLPLHGFFLRGSNQPV